MSHSDLKPTTYTVQPTTSTITWRNHWDHFLVRLGVKRGEHRVAPGLYALGRPTPDSPVLVTANYTLSFDALRASLAGIDAYILVLDTQGVNVWCAAGKGSFGTNELMQRIESTGLRDVVHHRALILPQLGAPGVAAHEVTRRTRFKVEYGPVRAADLPAYLETRQATPEMRRVRFPLRDRLVLIPVELVHIALPLAALIAVIALLTNADLADFGIAVAILTGIILFPILLPWLPTRDFSSKGFILGGLVALPFAVAAYRAGSDAATWRQVAAALAPLLLLPPATAYVALNFTGSSTFTSRTGVRREIFTYIPIMAWMFGIGLLFEIVLRLT